MLRKYEWVAYAAVVAVVLWASHQWRGMDGPTMALVAFCFTITWLLTTQRNRRRQK